MDLHIEVFDTQAEALARRWALDTEAARVVAVWCEAARVRQYVVIYLDRDARLPNGSLIR